MPTMKDVANHLESFDEDLCENGIGVSARSYIATASLLTYCSVLRFSFQGQMLPRGWLDILILGDTACGKSKIVETIVNKVKMGEFIKGENTSFAGLIGGLQQVGARAKWDIVWGRMPLNHGKLLVCDEISSLSLNAIGDMSAVRSSGVAEIVKVQGGVTRAATRMIWIGNPRSDQPMSHYTHGIVALQELIGKPEDIRRFDFAIAVTSSDVPLEIVNKRRELTRYNSKWAEMRQLIKWAWQLKPQEVSFDAPAMEAILHIAQCQAKDYSPNIPLVEPNEQRIKVARVSTAVAVRCLSEQGGRLIVKPHHVEYADFFMRKCFDSQALGYRKYSLAQVKQKNEDTQKINELEGILKMQANGVDACRVLLNCSRLTLADIETIFDVTRVEARSLASSMLRSGFLSRKRDFLAKTPMAIQILERILENERGS